MLLPLKLICEHKNLRRNGTVWSTSNTATVFEHRFYLNTKLLFHLTTGYKRRSAFQMHFQEALVIISS